MIFRFVLVCLFVVLTQVSMEFVLEKDVNDGSVLQIDIDNSRGSEGDFTLCIIPTNPNSRDCPASYACFIGPLIKSVRVDRERKLMIGMELMTTINKIVFNEDETVELILKVSPDLESVVKLLNVKRYVPPKPTTTTTEKSSNSATIRITVGVIVGLIIVNIVIAAAASIYAYCRKKKQKQVITSPVIVIQKALSTVEKRDPSPKASIKTEETTKKTPQEPSKTLSQPPRPPPKIATKLQSPTTVSIAAKSTSTQAQALPSAEPVPPQSAEPGSATLIVNSAEPTRTKEEGLSSKPDKNKSLKVEKTQAETPPSPPTPIFGNDPASGAMSKNSAFKEKANLPFNQTANVNKKKFRFKKCDELLGYERLFENITCYGMRFGLLDKHEDCEKTEMPMRPHEVYELKKAKMKRTKSVAVDAAYLIKHLKKESFGFTPQSGLQQVDRTASGNTSTMRLP